jgi:hypothetical protein
MFELDEDSQVMVLLYASVWMSTPPVVGFRDSVSPSPVELAVVVVVGVAVAVESGDWASVTTNGGVSKADPAEDEAG